MPGLLPDVDPDGLLEYSVVFTDRSLNHMSQSFQRVMRDLSEQLRGVYRAAAVAIVPGGGTYGMEAIARQFARDRRCLVVRNGYFSFRWSQIIETARLSDDVTVIMASRTGDDATSPFAPPPIDEVTATIRTEKPGVVFAPHVDTSSGILIPDDYIRALTAAVHEHGGLFVLDCVASGGAWVDMEACGVDVLLSAPQKGWSSTPCAAPVMLSAAAVEHVANSASDSFACDLGKWLDIMRAYENGGHAYHATLPTEGLKQFRDTVLETRAFGFDTFAERQWELGRRVRSMLEQRGFASVAADGFKAPGVVVSYTDDPGMQNGSRFVEQGLQIAAGVPLMCGEGDDYRSFRIGLFGIDKLKDIDGAVERLSAAIDRL